METRAKQRRDSLVLFFTVGLGLSYLGVEAARQRLREKLDQLLTDGPTLGDGEVDGSFWEIFFRVHL